MLGCFGLSQRTTDDELRKMCERYGAVEKVMLIIDRKTEVCFCFADFCTLKMSPNHVCSKMLKLPGNSNGELAVGFEPIAQNYKIGNVH